MSEKIAVHCRTKEEAEKICRKIGTKNSLSDWSKNTSCIDTTGSYLTFHERVWFKNNSLSFKIIPASEYLAEKGESMFKVGDEVEVIKERNRPEAFGKKGIVRDIDSKKYECGIEFYENVDGHNLGNYGNTCPDGYGWYFNKKQIKLVNKSTKPVKEEGTMGIRNSVANVFHDNTKNANIVDRHAKTMGFDTDNLAAELVMEANKDAVLKTAGDLEHKANNSE